MKKILANLTIVTFSLLTMIGATYALFEETVKVSGASFHIVSNTDGAIGGVNTDLKVLVNAGLPAEGANLDDEVPGPVFDTVSRFWVEDYPLKLYNQGEKTLDIVSKSDYISDTNLLRDDLYIEVFAWDDVNGDGIVDNGEIGVSYGHDTIMRWRNDTFLLGQIAPNETKGFVLRFDGSGLTDINIGMQALFDFQFIGTESL